MGFPYAVNRRPTASQNFRRRRISMTKIRPSLDVVYGICRGLPSGSYQYIIIISSQKRFTHESLITLPLISTKGYLFFSIHKQYPIGVIMISFTHFLKIKSKKSKIETIVRKEKIYKCQYTKKQTVIFLC